MENHVSLQIPQCVQGSAQFLLDTGSDLNMIKLSSLLDEVFVDETQIYQLKGINEYLVHTLGSVILDVQFGTKVEPTNFQVIRDDFPVPHEGILGKPFLVDNGLIIDYQASRVTQTNEEPIQVAPRTETIIAISTTAAEGSTFVIHSQPIGGENIRLGNVLSTVRQRQLLAVVVNGTENPVTLQPLQLEDVSCSEYQESTTLVATHSQKETGDTNRLKRIKETLQTEHLNPEECNSLWKICREFTNIFHLSGDTLTSTTTIHHEIRTPENATPINVRPYRLPYAHRQEIIKQMKELEENKIIQPSDSPWNAPLIVVPKKPDAQGKPQYRVCVDFRRLNQITVGDAFPIPRIDEILDQLGRSRYYSTLDLASGYHQVPIREEDRQKTAFSTDKGHYEFIQMPFGLSGAPSTFQRLMNSVLMGINGVKAFVYLDDIIIYATDLTDHESKLKEVFSRLDKHNLRLQTSKCQFLRREVIYLGHLITDKGVEPDPEKIRCVKDHPTPRNVVEIKQFLGLSGYYRRFIKDYSRISKPLTSLLKKNVPFEWTIEAQTAFDMLKEKLINAPILQYPNFEKEFILTTDASQFAIGSILSQGIPGQDLPVAYASRTLNKAEQAYSTTEKELLSIVWAVKHFRPYLLGREFKIFTDHQPLTWLFNVKDPGSRLMRWRLKLAEYNYEVVYKPGVTNTNADALSRIGGVNIIRTRSQTSQEDKSIILKSFEEYMEDPVSQNVKNANVHEVSGDIFETPEEFHLVHCVSGDLKLSRGIALEFRRRYGHIEKLKQQHPKKTEIAYFKFGSRYILNLVTKEKCWQKPTLQDIYESLLNLRRFCQEVEIKKLAMPRIGSGLDQLDESTVLQMIKYIFQNSGISIQVISQQNASELDKHAIIHEHHATVLGGHRGIQQTIKRIQCQYDWEGLKQDVTEFINKCTSCQVNKISNRNTKQPMIISTTASEPFEKVFIDVVGPLTRTFDGNAYILTMQCDLTKFSIATPMANKESNTVAYHFVTSFVCIHGMPQRLVSDQGTEFLSRVFTETCKLIGIKHSTTSPYHPQANGALERSHRTLGEYLRHYVDVNQQNWDSYVPYAMFVYNSSVHSSTGKQPYELLYGKTLLVPNSLTKAPEARYNYDDYQTELKQKLRESHQIARERLIQKKQKTKLDYDQTARSVDIHVGDRVLLQDKARKGKLSAKWLGPYQVLELNCNDNVTILRGKKKTKVHKNLVKPFIE